MERAPRVLVADDAPDHAEIARRALAKAGCDVDVVGDGDAALRRLTAPDAHYDLLLADLRMPGKDGAELARVLRGIAALRDLRIVIASSTDDADEIERARGSGADAFVPKAAGRAYAAALAALPAYYLSPYRPRRA